VTTRWVSEDGASDLAGLGLAIESVCPLVGVPYLALNLRLSRSRYAALRSYEQGFVKEGVGAGAALMAACLVLGCATDDLVGPIEAVYERLVLNQ
jgi:NaMN:DMB phosphoribosyltransferase